MRAVAFAAVLVVACNSTVSDGDGDDDVNIACCFELRCAPGQECYECTCRDSDCCAQLTCAEEQQVCIGCACISRDEGRDASVGGGPDEDADGFGDELDCDDGDDAVHPGALERCNLVDDDCDGSEDEGTCPGQVCCAEGCRDCCDDEDCHDDQACTDDHCIEGVCDHGRPAECADCCVELCEVVQPLECASVMRGDCTDFCGAVSGLQDQAGCTVERSVFEGCLSTCADPCAGGCDSAGEDLGDCLLAYCVDHLGNSDCQTLAASFGR